MLAKNLDFIRSGEGREYNEPARVVTQYRVWGSTSIFFAQAPNPAENIMSFDAITSSKFSPLLLIVLFEMSFPQGTDDLNLNKS